MLRQALATITASAIILAGPAHEPPTTSAAALDAARHAAQLKGARTQVAALARAYTAGSLLTLRSVVHAMNAAGARMEGPGDVPVPVTAQAVLANLRRLREQADRHPGARDWYPVLLIDALGDREHKPFSLRPGPVPAGAAVSPQEAAGTPGAPPAPDMADMEAELRSQMHAAFQQMRSHLDQLRDRGGGAG